MTALRKRISVALTSVVVLFIVVQTHFAYSSLKQQEGDLVDDIVISETRRLIERMSEGDSTMQSANHAVRLASNMTAWLVTPDGPPAAVLLPSYLAAIADGPHRMHRLDRGLHVVVATTPAGRLFVQYDATRNEEFVRRFGAYLTATGPLFIAIGWTVSLVLARIVVAPLQRLTLHLAQWSPGSPERPIGRSDEETMLLQAFDQAERRLDELLEREREFAANVRHEVRTPLTALRTDAEMLLLTESLTPQSRSRVQRMISAVDSVADAVQARHSLQAKRDSG